MIFFVDFKHVHREPRKAPEIFYKTALTNLAKFTRKQMPLLELFLCSKKELSRKCLSVNHRRNFPLRTFFSKYDQACSFLQI